MNVQQIARSNTAWIQAPPLGRMTCYVVITILCGMILSMGLVYVVASGIATLLR